MQEQMQDQRYPTHLQLVKPETEAAFIHAGQLRWLNDFAVILLFAAGGDKRKAESMLDNIVDLLFEGGALSTWRYRLVLERIKDGLS
jgi:hypothetical protein